MRSIILAIALLLPSICHGASLEMDNPALNIKTNKVAYVRQSIDEKTSASFLREMEKTAGIPGPRLIVIDSDGGYVRDGEKMLDAIRAEKAKGVKVICYVVSKAHSMAFNILTNCDLRLSSPSAMMLVHKIRYIGGIPAPNTAKNLRKFADDLDRDDEKYRQANSKAMGLTLEDYDNFADRETTWRAQTLLKLGYLHGLGKLRK